MLSVSGVSRSHQGSQLSCLASNNNISAPSATSLVLDVQVLPVLVKISATEVDLVEGGGVSLECVVSGGNPRPSVYIKVFKHVDLKKILSKCQVV